MPVQRPARSLLTALLATLLLVVGSVAASPAGAGTAQDEQLFVQMINQTRAAAGLPPLTVHSELTQASRSWASSMATNDTLAHAPDISAGISAPWIVLGENVGVHDVQNVQQLHDAFVASPAHYKNIVDPRFRYIGVGVVVTGEGKMWTTHRFMATAEPTVATTPPTTAPPTTAAPATTAPPAPVDAPAAAPAPTPTTAAPRPSSTSTSTSTSAPARAAPASDRSTATGDGDHSDPDEESEHDGDDDGHHDDDDDDDGHGDHDEHDAGPGAPDVDTVEQMLIDLIAAGL